MTNSTPQGPIDAADDPGPLRDVDATDDFPSDELDDDDVIDLGAEPDGPGLTTDVDDVDAGSARDH